jgi:hypothetical protein
VLNKETTRIRYKILVSLCPVSSRKRWECLGNRLQEMYDGQNWIRTMSNGWRSFGETVFVEEEMDHHS